MTYIPTSPGYTGWQAAGLQDIGELFVKPEMDRVYLHVVGQWRCSTQISADTRQFDTAARQILQDCGFSPNNIRAFRERGLFHWVILKMEVWRCGLHFASGRSHSMVWLDHMPAFFTNAVALKETYDQTLENAMMEAGSKLKVLLESVGIEEVLLATHT